MSPISEQRLEKQLFAAATQHATTEELLETVSHMRFVLRLYNEASSRVRVTGFNPGPGGITGPPCSWGYKSGGLALQVGGVSNLRQ
jgi:hypothetical protein